MLLEEQLKVCGRNFAAIVVYLEIPRPVNADQARSLVSNRGLRDL